MGRINTRRVILGGLLAGLIVNIAEFLVYDRLMRAKWDAGPRTEYNTNPVGSMAITLSIVGGFAAGMLMVWLYAAVRPRVGASPGTALWVGLMIWALGSLLTIMPLIVLRMLPSNEVWGILLTWNAIKFPLAVLVGAWVYRENSK